MTYGYNQKTGEIVDTDTWRVIAKLADGAVPGQGQMIADALNGLSTTLTDMQRSAIKCAYGDLVGVYQCAIRDGNGGADNGHDWKAHALTVKELEANFPFLDYAPLEEDDVEWGNEEKGDD